MRYRPIQKPRHISFERFFLSIWTLHTYSRSQIPLNCKDSTRNGQVIAQKWLFSPVQRAIPNFSKNRLREVDGRAMPIGKMVWFVILPFGNPKSARGRHPYLRKPFPFVTTSCFYNLLQQFRPIICSYNLLLQLVNKICYYN